MSLITKPDYPSPCGDLVEQAYQIHYIPTEIFTDDMTMIPEIGFKVIQWG